MKMIVDKIKNVWPVWMILLAGCMGQDENNPEPDDIFVKYYGGNGLQEVADVIVTENGEFVLFGNQRITGSNTRSFYLVKTDPAGNLLTEKTISFGISNAGVDTTEEVAGRIKRIDGGYAIIGSSQIVNGIEFEEVRLFWAILDEDFEMENQYMVLDAGALNMAGRDLLPLEDGTYILAGYSEVQESNDQAVAPAGRQLFIARADLDSVYWKRTFGYSSSDEEVIYIDRRDDGTITLIGSASNRVGQDGGLGNNVTMFVLNPDGTSPLSAKVYGIELNGDTGLDDVPADVAKTSWGYVIAGTSSVGTRSYPFILGLDRSGLPVSDTDPPLLRGILRNEFGEINATGRSLAQLPGGDYALVGTFPDFSSEQVENGLSKGDEIMMMSVSSGGEPKFGSTRNYGLAAGDDHADKVIALADGSIVVGATVDFGSGVTLMALMKLNAEGELKP